MISASEQTGDTCEGVCVCVCRGGWMRDEMEEENLCCVWLKAPHEVPLLSAHTGLRGLGNGCALKTQTLTHTRRYIQGRRSAALTCEDPPLDALEDIFQVQPGLQVVLCLPYSWEEFIWTTHWLGIRHSVTVNVQRASELSSVNADRNKNPLQVNLSPNLWFLNL